MFESETQPGAHRNETVAMVCTKNTHDTTGQADNSCRLSTRSTSARAGRCIRFGLVCQRTGHSGKTGYSSHDRLARRWAADRCFTKRCNARCSRCCAPRPQNTNPSMQPYSCAAARDQYNDQGTFVSHPLNTPHGPYVQTKVCTDKYHKNGDTIS